MVSSDNSRIRRSANWFPAVLCGVTLLAALNFSRRTPWATPPPAIVRPQVKPPSPTLLIPPQAVLLGFVDVVQIKAPGEDGSGPMLAAMGWAASSASGAPLKKVVMLVDGKPRFDLDAAKNDCDS